MNKSSLLGIILIALVVSLWIFYQSMTTRRDVTPEQTQRRREQVDSIQSTIVPPSAARQLPPVDFIQAPPRTLTIETDLLRVRLSSEGATIRSWKLKKYRPWYKDSVPGAIVDLIHPGAHEFGFSFRTITGAKIVATDVPFNFSATSDTIRLTGNETTTINAIARVVGGGSIVRSYTFTGSTYDVKTSITLNHLEDLIPQTNRFINLEWSKGIRYQEGSSVDESNNAVAMASFNGDLDELDAKDFHAPELRTAAGKIDYLATRTKYFAVALVPPAGFDGTAFYAGQRFGSENGGHIEQYSLAYRLPYKGGEQKHDVMLYAGPMQYDTLARYGLTNIMNLGWKWIVKPIGEYFMIPTMKAIHFLVPNWGISIIIFALILKALLYPLSITQLKSARKMQLVAPLMNEIREKYKDDVQTQQQETMKLYGEYGINPAGGCLPLLLQMPILYAMYSVLSLNIDIRQAAFLPVWITDLSIPDVILSIPFKVPLFNIDKFSGLALLMGATLFIQQKQTVTDPRQKGLVYLMPIMLTLMFSALPAGLNLYYFVFNIVGISQQVWMTKFSKTKLTLEDIKKLPKKESWLQRKMREAQEIAQSQGRTLPGQAPRKGGPNGSPSKRGAKRR
ncbi:MAG: membrane protein insertase YidC [Ignavibacteria bacterium]|nr:membrane protein insertase YidC [Ignavibacteria bacterium]